MSCDSPYNGQRCENCKRLFEYGAPICNCEECEMCHAIGGEGFVNEAGNCADCQAEIDIMMDEAEE